MDEYESLADGDVSQLAPADWFKRFVYVAEGDLFFDVKTHQDYSRQTFNALFRGTPCYSVHNKARRIEAATFFDENRAAMGSYVANALTYAPGETELLKKAGVGYVNKWKDSRPAAQSADVSLWLNHLHRMIPADFEREHVLNVMAYKRQNPQRKINHAVLHTGLPGGGKDTLWAPFLWSIGGGSLKNIAVARAEEVAGSWGYTYESEVIVLNEIRYRKGDDRRAMENNLKPVIAAPPELLLVNKKQQHPYYVVNRIFVLAFSNDRAPITIPADDRRWFVVWSVAPRLPDDEAARLWDWYGKGGFEAVAGYLDARDVSAFNPGAVPPLTDAKLAMVDLGMSGGEAFIADMVRQRRGVFARGVIGSPWSEVLSGIAAGTDGHKPSRETLFVALRESGWKDIGRVMSREYQTPKHLWVAPELADRSKSDIRAMVEGKPDLQMVK
jgi:hypothetical protein